MRRGKQRAGLEGKRAPWAAAFGAVGVLAAQLAQAADVAGGAHVVTMAVASNFSQTAGRLCRAFFAQRTGRCMLTAGASGLLASQAAQGAPFDVLLSADRKRAERLEIDGVAVRGSRFTYAIGRLVLWSPRDRGVADLRAALDDERVKTLAIANPRSAPYGAAALETLRALGYAAEKRFRIVQGENVAQAFQFVASGAADAGFVAQSQVKEYEAATGKDLDHEVFVVDATLHQPIEQQAVLLAKGAANPDARQLLEFLRSDPARRIIDAAGYSVP